jgi:hypothetical protein
MSDFLRRAFLLDAVVSGSAGLLMAAGAVPLHGLLDLPVSLLRIAGLVLIPYALELAWFSKRSRLAAPAVWAVIATNLAWAAASIGILVAGTVHPNALGYAFVVVQAVAVAGLAELQYIGLRKTAALAA